MPMTNSEASSEEADESSSTDFDRGRGRLGLTPLTPEGRTAIDWAISQNTPAAARLQQLLEIAKRLGAGLLPSDDLNAWGSALADVDTLGYCARLIEAQIIAGNVGQGILLPDAHLEIEW